MTPETDPKPVEPSPPRLEKSESSRDATADSSQGPKGYANEVEQKLKLLPASPGCYLFLDKTGAVLYVGKAKSLRSRVRSYFQEGGSDERYFIPILRRVVRNLDTVVTATEKEAAVLENELIKKHKPRFNVKLRDDKDFLCLRLDLEKAWPRLETVRRPSPDGARYYGPYHSATSARRTLHLVNKHFHLRTCSDADFASRKRPCLQHQIKRCPGPCVIDVHREEYLVQARAVGLFLEGRHDELTKILSERMRDAAHALEFESAAIYRDQVSAVESIRERQRVVSVSDVDQDVVGLYREGSVVEIEVLFVRSGRVSDTVSYSLRRVELPDEEVLAGFLSEYYAGERESGPVPSEVLLPVLPDGADGFAELLSERRGRKVALLVPQRGPRKKLLEMAYENAKHSFHSKRRAADDLEARLAELQERLRLPVLPRRIECCDISHLGGDDTVGSIVALENGELDKKRYRSFHVKGATGGDDYAAMYEVLARRFRRAVEATALAAREAALEVTETFEAPPEILDGEAEDSTGALDPAPVRSDGDSGSGPIARSASTEANSDEVLAALDDADAPDEPAFRGSDWDLPDLFVVDGGRGQLNVALAAARDLGIHDLAIVGLAKERETVTGDKMVDRVYLPGQKNGIPLRTASSSLFFLARARDEAHRFANHLRKRLGQKTRLRSELDEIPGIGPKTKAALLKTLGSLSAIRGATDEEILAVSGVTKRHLAALRNAGF